jgi:hypothetical protein
MYFLGAGRTLHQDIKSTGFEEKIRTHGYPLRLIFKEKLHFFFFEEVGLTWCAF